MEPRLHASEPVLDEGPQDVELDRDEDDHSHRDVLEVRVETEQVEAVVHDPEDQRTCQGVQDTATAAQEAASADDHRGDGAELQALPGERRAGVSGSDEEHAADGPRQPAHDVDRDQRPVHRHARADRGFGAATDGVDPSSPDQLVQDDGTDDREDDHHERGVGEPSDVARARDPRDTSAAEQVHDRRGAQDGGATGDVEGEAGADAQGGEGGDEGMRQTPPHQQQPVDQTDGQPRQQGDPDGQPRRVGVAVDDSHHDAAQRDVRADRQVDAPGQDHEELAQGDDADTGGLLEDVADIPERQE